MENRNIYDGYLDWKNWGENFGKLNTVDRRYYNLELKKLESNWKGKKVKVLEIGFGNGTFLTYARDKDWDIHGIEINDDLINSAKDHDFKVSKSIDDYDDNTFDLIVAFDVLEHILADELIDFICKIKNKLNHGGKFIARFPNGDSPIGMRNQNGDLTHLNSIGSNKIIQLSKICKLELISIKGQGEIFIYNSIKKSLYTIILFPIKMAINFIMKSIFFPTSYYFFSSENLIIILKKAN